MLTLVSYDDSHLALLAPLQPGGEGPEALRRELTDLARGHGRQVAVALADDIPCGVAGWVSFGVEIEGIVYGVPVLARVKAAARLLLDHLAHQARALGARQLRVSCFPGEEAKHQALRESGFDALLDMISMERPSEGLPMIPFPADLRPVSFDAIDWERFANIHNRVFAGVPNTPPLTAEVKQQEWEGLDRVASQLYQDGSGRYLAWIGVTPEGYVEEIGVEAALRGQGIAVALYRIAGELLAARGVRHLHTLLASTNLATLRLHAKLGFQEFARRTVYAKAL